MAERQDSEFKVTDRRKFHSDGSPRDDVSPAPAPAPRTSQPEAQAEAPAAGNVLSFPSESKKQAEQASTPQQPAAAKPAEGGSVDQSAMKAAAGQVERAYNQMRGPASPGLPEASFLTLVNMLAVEAAMHLGLLQNPGEEPPPLDLESARHLIDMLGMLQGKSRGNLTADEDRQLENVLADLRMQFVAISRGR